MANIVSLFQQDEKPAAPPPPPVDAPAQVPIHDVWKLQPQQLRDAAHSLTHGRNPARYFTFGYVLLRIQIPALYRRWGHETLHRYLLDELHFKWIGDGSKYTLTYQRARDLDVHLREMEEIEQRYPLKHVQVCAQLAGNKHAFFEALKAPNPKRFLSSGIKATRGAFDLGPFALPRKKFLIVQRLLEWLKQEFKLSDGDALTVMALVMQAWVEQPRVHRQRFLRTHCKLLDLNPEIAERFF